MTIWEQSYSERIETGSAQADSKTEKKQAENHPLPSVALAPNTGSSGSGSFKETYHQKGNHQPVHPQATVSQQATLSKPVKHRFTPRLQLEKLSTPYPDTLSKINDELSDIWANILIQTQQTIETLLVCGSTRKEGNTFVSFYLAMFLSKEYDMNILYVDSNLNHSAIPKIRNLPGLYSFVVEKADLSSMIVKTEYPGLYLLPSGAGRIAKNIGYNQLSREPVEFLMNYCRKNFDMTVIDGQPITSSPVMIEFARLTDMTALVCRYGFSRREVSKQAIDKLSKFNTPSIGVILNNRQFPIPQVLYKMMG
jgi:Mrp family chromosome partitioning ATPase